MKRIDPFPGRMMMEPIAIPFVTKKGTKGVCHTWAYVLNNAQRQWFCRWFPETENAQLMQASGMKFSTLHRFARLYGLKKSEKGLKGIKRRQAAHIKKVCESNGWYDSMRGKPLSEAARQGAARVWQEIREGKRQHPLHVMKRKNPRRYRKLMQYRSDKYKELIHKETRRVLYGLERKTKLIQVVMNRYTRSQVCHRYNAMRRGYILMQDNSEAGGERYNIYYDEQTQRSALFETNLINDGFRLHRWQD